MASRVLVLLPLLFAVTFAWGQDDAPDANREQNFHRIYEKYNAAPTPIEAWEQASASRQSELYKVQRGDTLWDLSRTLFGDPAYWPKVWALNNDEVTNPHEIETWMQIRFFPGDLNEPPTVMVAEATPAEVTLPKDGEVAPKAAPAPGDVALIPPPKRSVPLVRALPGSVPLWRIEAASPLPDFQIANPINPIIPAQIALTYKISELPVTGVGEVKETELGLKTASEFQYVFVEVGGSDERIFTVVKDVGVVRDPALKNEEGRQARLIEVQGEVEVVEAVSENQNLRRAIVRRNLTPIEVGGRLIPGRIEMVSTEDGGIVDGPSAKIIGASYGEGRRLVDPGGIVFLNGGAATGLQEGMILAVHSNVRARSPGTGAVTNDRTIGRLRIVGTTQNFATAVLTAAAEDVQIGDTAGGRGTVAAAPSSFPASPSDMELDGDLDAGDDSGDSLPAAPPSDAPEIAPTESSAGEGDEELTL